MAKTHSGGTALSTGITVQANKPLDDRFSVDTFTNLLNPSDSIIDAYLYPWIPIVANDTGIRYKWNGQDRTIASNWVVDDSIPSLTYSQLSSLKDARNLKTGWYVLTGYIHKYVIENSNTTDLQYSTSTGESYVVGLPYGGSLPTNDGDLLYFIDSLSNYNDVDRHFIGAALNTYYVYGITSGARASITRSDWYYWQISGITGTFQLNENLRFEGPGLYSLLGVAPGTTILDGNSKALFKPNGVINVDVHDGSSYGSMSSSENTAPIPEDILLYATSSSSFSNVAYSVTHPSDELVYDFNDNSFGLNGEVNTRNGFILRRHDRVNNININLDFRNEKKRSWPIDFSASNFNYSGVTEIPNIYYGNGTSTPSSDVKNRYCLPYPGFDCGINPSDIDLTNVPGDSLLDGMTSDSNNFLLPLDHLDFKDTLVINMEGTVSDVYFSDNVSNLVVTADNLSSFHVFGIVTDSRMNSVEGGYVYGTEISSSCTITNTIFCSSNIILLQNLFISGIISNSFFGSFLIECNIGNIFRSYFTGGNTGIIGGLVVNGFQNSNLWDIRNTLIAKGLSVAKVGDLRSSVLVCGTALNNDLNHVKGCFFSDNAYLSAVTFHSITSSRFNDLDLFRCSFMNWVSCIYSGDFSVDTIVISFPVRDSTITATNNIANLNIVSVNDSLNNFIKSVFIGVSPNYSLVY